MPTEAQRSAMLAAMGIVALFANLTGYQRTAFVRAELRKKGR